MPLPGPTEERKFSMFNQNIPSGARGASTANTKLSDLFAFYPASDQINPAAVSEIKLPDTPTYLQNFDYLILKYTWTSANGTDLDTFTGFIETGTAYDNDWIGFAQGSDRVPDSAPQPYLYWGGDITANVGSESVLVDITRFNNDYPTISSGDLVKIKMNAVWYSTKNDGNVQVELVTYKGGVMTLDVNGRFFYNDGGTLVQHITLNTNVAANNRISNIANSSPVALFTFDRVTKTALLELASSGVSSSDVYFTPYITSSTGGIISAHDYNGNPITVTTQLQIQLDVSADVQSDTLYIDFPPGYDEVNWDSSLTSEVTGALIMSINPTAGNGQIYHTTM